MMNKPIKRSINKANLVLQIFLIACALLVGWALWSRRQPDRLLELDVALPNFSLSADRLVWSTYKDPWQGKGPRIVARSIRGGAERVVLEENTQFHFNEPDCFAVRD